MLLDVKEKLVEEVALQLPTFTIIFPEVALEGTVAVIVLSLTTVNVLAFAEPIVTEVAPVNPEPVKVMIVPVDPVAGVKELMLTVDPQVDNTVPFTLIVGVQLPPPPDIVILPL